MPAYLAMYRAFTRAMESGRIEDAAAIMEEACLPPVLIGSVLTDYYADERVRPAIADALRAVVR